MQIKTLTPKTKHTPLRISVAALAVLLVCCAAFAGAASAVWDGNSTDTTWYNSSKSSFTITNENQLAGLAKLVNAGTAFSGKTINLGKDLDLSSNNWTAIGTNTHQFKGTFDGQNHTISHLFISATTENQGLFGQTGTGCVIKNVRLLQASVKGTSNVGSLVGAHNGGNITNSYATGKVVATSATGKSVGGLVGIMNTGSLITCHADADISGSVSASGGVSDLGGLVGEISNNGGNIVNCYATGTVSGYEYVGGLVGSVSNTAASITNCYATGSVSGVGGPVGGLIGYFAGQTITNCYATGTPSVADTAGKVGGLVGRLSGGSITSSIALNKRISGAAPIGRIVGQNDVSTTALTNCYAWDGMTLNGAKVEGGGNNGNQATKNMTWNNDTFYKTLFTPFDTNWVMATGDKYKLPILQGATVPKFDARYLDPDKTIPENTILVNDAELAGTNLFKNESSGTYYAYEGAVVTIPLFLTGNATHKYLGGFDILFNITAGKSSISQDEYRPVIPSEYNWSLERNENSVVGSPQDSKSTIIDLSTDTTFLNLKIPGLLNSTKLGGNYEVRIKPNTAGFTDKGAISMFSGFPVKAENMSLSQFDQALFNAANADKLILSIYVYGIPDLSRIQMPDYAIDTPDPSVTIFWERENATGKNSVIIAEFDESIMDAEGITWGVMGKAPLFSYISLSNPTVSGERNITSSFITNESVSKVDGMIIGLTSLSFTLGGKTITSTVEVSVGNWLQNQTWGNNFDTIGQNLTWVLNVSAARVNTKESTNGWQTYANFTDAQNYTGLEIPVRDVTYTQGTTTLSKNRYTILNEKGNESIMIGSGIYIKNNEINDADKYITITFNGHQLGDATMNGYINVADSTAMGIDILRKHQLFNNTVNMFFADVSEVKDGKITAVDVQRLNKYLVE